MPPRSLELSFEAERSSIARHLRMREAYGIRAESTTTRRAVWARPPASSARPIALAALAA